MRRHTTASVFEASPTSQPRSWRSNVLSRDVLKPAIMDLPHATGPSVMVVDFLAASRLASPAAWIRQVPRCPITAAASRRNRTTCLIITGAESPRRLRRSRPPAEATAAGASAGGATPPGRRTLSINWCRHPRTTRTSVGEPLQFQMIRRRPPRDPARRQRAVLDLVAPPGILTALAATPAPRPTSSCVRFRTPCPPSMCSDTSLNTAES